MLEKMVQFLEENVNGRDLFTDELVYELNGGELQGVYRDQISFSNLLYNQVGCRFDMFIVANERIYQLGADGTRGALHKNVGAVSLFRYELAKRNSTGGVTGCFRFISASGREVYAGAVVSGVDEVRLENGRLHLREEQALYRDQPCKEGGYRPVAFAAEQEFFLQEGKLHFVYEAQSFDVNPATRARTPSRDRYPSFHSVEK